MMQSLRTLWSRWRRPASGAGSGGGYVYQPARAALGYDEAVDRLAAMGYEVRRGQVPDPDDAAMDRMAASLRESGIAVEDFATDLDEYQGYVEKAGYLSRYPEYYCDNRPEKTLEHYVAYRTLGLGPHDTFIDLASEHSPVPEIYSRLTGARCYAQDIQYPPGVHGDRIGGDACAMPLPDGFASAAALTCSLEHFEGEGDARLFTELTRVLRPGGRLVVAPLYLADHAATQTDPLYSAETDVVFDPDCVVYCKPSWGNRHGRFYSPQTLAQRVVRPHPRFDFTIYRLRYRDRLPSGIYLRFFMVCTRR